MPRSRQIFATTQADCTIAPNIPSVTPRDGASSASFELVHRATVRFDKRHYGVFLNNSKWCLRSCATAHMDP